ncbi:MAG TPA: hypothetical protein VE133_08800 [Candidatus Sulfotelmatobacter sp.]|nr:hypothetical protein [Candidatus Sulfotelmatobacter sp.]
MARSLVQIGKEELTPANLVSILLRSEEGWDRVSAFVCAVMKKKMEAEWARQAQSQVNHT